MSFLRVSNVIVQGTDGPLLQGITFKQRRGEKVAIAGETGSGKSTLLKVIAGLSQADQGEVFLKEERVEGSHEKLVPGHPSIAYLSQHFELPKFLRVEQALSYATVLGESRSDLLYEVCQVSHLLKRKTDQLSGGERQRIALARLLSRNPTLLLLDEPFSNLDVIHKDTLREVIDDLSGELDISVILVSHDADDSLPWADTILLMKDGKIVQSGPSREVYFSPVDEYCAGLFGSFNVLTPEQRRILQAGDRKIVRPAQLTISSTPVPDALECTISKVKFFGTIVELEVSIGDDILHVASMDHSWTAGDHAFLSFKHL